MALDAEQRLIHIAAAVIRDDAGRTLLVRKKGTDFFMQAGGKIEPGETALESLRRELQEELQVSFSGEVFLGEFEAPAANEADHKVVAQVFSVRLDNAPICSAELAEMTWHDKNAPADIPIAPLSRLLLVQSEVDCARNESSPSVDQ